MSEFAALGLSAPLLKALAATKYLTPTPIQKQAIPPALAGLDVIGCAATGTGKTAAFTLPMVERLQGKTGVRGLVLAPTRELAIQIAQHAENFGAARGLSVATLIGGVGMGGQIIQLRKANIIIATPGRLIDHLDERHTSLDNIEILVLDEADRMLDMGFKPQLTKILNRVPRKRQTLLFSATMAGEVANFAKMYLHNPTRVEVARSGTTAARASQCVYECSQGEKTPLLITLLQQSTDSTLVFTRTKRRSDKVQKSLARAGFRSDRIHGDRSQGQRQQALEGFRSGTYRVLVATDIAARGIDVADIGHVINYDLPHVPEDYVHRVGRTARAASSGRASAFVSPEERPLLKDIEKLTRAPVPRAQVPRNSPEFQAALKAEGERAAQGGGGGGGGGFRGRSFEGRRSGGGGGGRGQQRSSSGGSGNRSSSSSNSSATSSGSGSSGPAKQVFSGGPRGRR